MKRYILLVLGLLSVAQTDAVKCEGNHLHFLPDPEKCESYFTCYEGEPYPQICDEGLYFNPVSRQCDYKTAISCVKCPEGKIKKLPYEGSCSKYILCFAGTPLERECSAGFQFNEKLEECDLEKNVNCIDVKCPAVDVPGNPTFIPHPKDCAKYYICLKGTPIEFSCPAGTHYNPNTELCDTIENAKCTIANIFSLWQMKSEDICPPTGAHALPNPESCTNYYMCINGAKIEESCGSDFIFDTITLTCTSDDDGVCILETNSTPKPEDINFECTGTATEFHPDPKDCNAYYICVNGVAFHDYCSRGFIFDIVTKECDVQGNSICICDLNPKLCPLPSTTQDPTETESPEPTPTDPNPTDEPVSTDEPVPTDGPKPTETDEPEKVYPREFIPMQQMLLNSMTARLNKVCPDSGIDILQVPDPEDCSKYYLCLMGSEYHETCSTNMIFDVYEEQCQTKDKATCIKDLPIVPTPSEPSLGDIECNDDEMSEKPDPNDCEKYYVCVFGQLFHESCGKGMIFDVSSMKCGLESQSICVNINPTISTNPTSRPPTLQTTTPNGIVKPVHPTAEVPTPPSRPPTAPAPSVTSTIPSGPPTTTRPSTTNSSSTRCPPSEITYSPHPYNCNQYQQCYFGKLYVRNCPKNMHWNRWNYICDTPVNAGCQK